MRWSAARDSLNLWLLAIVLLQACHASSGSAVVLELRPAVKVGPVKAECNLSKPVQDASVALPAGTRINVRFAAAHSIALNVTSETKLVMRDITASNPAGTSSWEVVVFPDDVDANRIKRALRSKPSCNWLVTVRGKIVQLAFPAERGDGGISGGLFPSLDAALLAYGRAREDVLVETQSSREGSRAQSFWSWRREMDLWQIACDSELRKKFRENDPKSFERLCTTLEKVDCSREPTRPADNADSGKGRD